MTTYNKFASIKIGGTYTNQVPATYNQGAIMVSLDCSGNLITNQNSYLAGDLYLGYEYQDPSLNYIVLLPAQTHKQTRCARWCWG